MSEVSAYRDFKFLIISKTTLYHIAIQQIEKKVFENCEYAMLRDFREMLNFLPDY